ncbi:hypothetical protein R1flu_004610 [Riccia fluitans]|uniref:Uncharacterized protein n=1 Tax=Riccia fluitans TaxID=41844 RepID=A0ABD1YQT5_9MARC
MPFTLARIVSALNTAALYRAALNGVSTGPIAVIRASERPLNIPFMSTTVGRALSTCSVYMQGQAPGTGYATGPFVSEIFLTKP